MTGNPILSVKNLIVRRGKTTVLQVDHLHVDQGRTLALIGPNGAGKSTLLLAMAGLLPVAGGSLFFGTKRIENNSDFSELRRHAAVVFQEPLLLDTTVEKNVAVGLEFRRLRPSDIKKNVEEALSYFGIAHLARRSARMLSGGESKRVSLARAFAIRPKVILLDEAFNSLDPPSRESIMDEFQSILKETKTTAVLALHDREETLRLADDVAVMTEGKVIQRGTTAHVFQAPADEFIANFVGTEVILEGVVQQSDRGLMEIDVNGRTIEASGDFPVGQKVYCCVRPENITIAQNPSHAISARNVFQSRVLKIMRQGFFYKVFMDCGFPLAAYITIPSREELGISDGETVTASFKATAVHVIRREK